MPYRTGLLDMRKDALYRAPSQGTGRGVPWLSFRGNRGSRSLSLCGSLPSAGPKNELAEQADSSGFCRMSPLADASEGIWQWWSVKKKELRSTKGLCFSGVTPHPPSAKPGL
jgi:hypothetical protein